MNLLLLDTHALIWFLENDSHLPVATVVSENAHPCRCRAGERQGGRLWTRKEEIESADTVFASIASLWEIAIKLNIGKIALQGAYETIEAGLDNAGLTLLQISFADTLQVRHLPLHHRDPFDRIIVAKNASSATTRRHRSGLPGCQFPIRRRSGIGPNRIASGDTHPCRAQERHDKVGAPGHDPSNSGKSEMRPISNPTVCCCFGSLRAILVGTKIVKE